MEGFGQTETTLIGRKPCRHDAEAGLHGQAFSALSTSRSLNPEGKPVRRSARRARSASTRAIMFRAASSSATTETRRRPRKHGTTAGTTPATPRGRMRTATSGTSDASTTSSSRADTASGRSRSSRSSWSSRMSSSARSQRLRTRSADRLSRRRSSSSRARRSSDELKKEIQNYVKTHTAPYKYPRIVEFMDELPKTISGKIQTRGTQKQRQQQEIIKRGGSPENGLPLTALCQYKTTSHRTICQLVPHL